MQNFSNYDIFRGNCINNRKKLHENKKRDGIYVRVNAGVDTKVYKRWVFTLKNWLIYSKF